MTLKSNESLPDKVEEFIPESKITSYIIYVSQGDDPGSHHPLHPGYAPLMFCL